MLVSLGKPEGHLITDASYRDYRLEVEYRFAGKPGNCGVLVHASRPRALQDVPAVDRSADDERQRRRLLVHPGEHRGPRHGEAAPAESRREVGRRRGRRRRILNLTDNSEKPVGEWNTMAIEARGRTIKVWVNGDLVNEGSNATADHGKIALQAEGTEVESGVWCPHPRPSRGPGPACIRGVRLAAGGELAAPAPPSTGGGGGGCGVPPSAPPTADPLRHKGPSTSGE